MLPPERRIPIRRATGGGPGGPRRRPSLRSKSRRPTPVSVATPAVVPTMVARHRRRPVHRYTIDADGMTVKVSHLAMPAEDDPEFGQMAMALDRGRTMHTRTMARTTTATWSSEVVIIGEDRDPPMPVPFAKFEVHTVNTTTNVIDVTTPQALNARLDARRDTDDNPADTFDASVRSRSVPTARPVAAIWRWSCRLRLSSRPIQRVLC